MGESVAEQDRRSRMRRTGAAAALFVGLAAGGYGIASAAGGSGTAGATTTAPQGYPAPGGRDHDRGPRGPRPERTALTGDTLAKATAAAKAKVPGASVEGAFADDHGQAAYVVVMKKADGTRVAVRLDAAFAVVDVRTGPGRGPRGPGGHGTQTALTGDTLAKATAAAKAKVPGASVEGAFADDHGQAAYVVVMKKADGTRVAVRLDAAFAVVDVRTGPGRGPRGHGKETALTGDTLAKVTAAATAKVPGATVDRAETDAGGRAKYEAHMTKADGTHVTVYVNAAFEAVAVESAPAGRGGPGGRHP